MTRLTVELPEELQRKLRLRAAEAGAASVEAYVQELLYADAAGIDPGAPVQQSIESHEQLEGMLLERLDDPRPSIEPDEQFWQKLKRRTAGGEGRQP